MRIRWFLRHVKLFTVQKESEKINDRIKVLNQMNGLVPLA